MKWFAKYIVAVVVMSAGSGVYAQTAAEPGIENPATLAEAKAPAAIDAKELGLTIINSCEKHIVVFAGSKKEVFDGKSETLGGRSTNKIYIREGDVVCIMNSPKSIQACAIAKDGTSKIEINSSGNGFVK